MKVFSAWLLGLMVFVSPAPAAPLAIPSTHPLTVVAEFYPIYVTLLNITNDAKDVRVANLVPTTTGCPEDYQLTPGDLKLLSQADIFVVNGAGLEGYLGKLAAQCPNLKVVEASAGLELLKIDGEENPHLWVSPSMAAQQVRNIANALIKMDPARAGLYQKNATAYIARLQTLGQTLREGLAAAPVRRIVAFHDSFPYLARDLNLEIIATIEPAPGQNPSARELADVVNKVRSTSGSVALLTEIDAKNPAAEVLSRELDQQLFSLDTVTGGPMDPALAKEAYFHAMEKNLAVLQKALRVKNSGPAPTAKSQP